MKTVPIAWIVLLCGFAVAQPKAVPQAVTVPAVIDHNRIVIDAAVPMLNGSMQHVRAWVDNGDPDLNLSRKLSLQLGLTVSCNDQECSSPPPPAIIIGEMTIPLTAVKEAKIPLKPVNAASVLAPGMNADINLPASVLRHYDVLIDFPGHRFSIGSPGSIHFLGTASKVEINAENGLIQVPSRIDNKKYNLALDLGSSISLLSEELLDSLAKQHADWPHMTGAVGSANMWGAEPEATWKVMRLDRVQYGPLFLTDVAVVSLPKTVVDFFERRAGMPTVGSLGSNVFLSYRVGLDYAHSTVYFDIGRLFKFPDFDVVGLVLRPQDDGGYAILGVPDFEGRPAVQGVQPGDRLIAVNDIPVTGLTMGQVWSMLGGTPGQERKLTIERGGKQFAVAANVQHFLPEVPESNQKRK
jgi:PDZ domain